MSPEQTRGEPLDARSDLFSLGCVLYEAATGKRPFRGPSALAVMHEVATVNPPPPSALAPALPKAFDAIVRRTLAKDKERRYGSAAELAGALRGLTAPGRATRKVLARVAILAAAVAALAVAVGLWYWWRQAGVDWARRSVVQVEQLAAAERYFEAYDLAAQARKVLPDDPTLARLMPTIADELSVTTEPAGAGVYLQRFARDGSGQFPARQRVGTTPIDELPIARGDYLLTIEKDGYAPVQRTISSALDRVERAVLDPKASRREVGTVETPSREVRLRLDANAPIRVEARLVERAQAPGRMVFVPGGEYALVAWGKPVTPEARLDDYFIDQFEVTNQEYKEFITAGGYRNKQFWKVPFAKEGKTLSWEDAVRQFKDRTGLPGPRGWSNQDFPEGQAQHPVTGVTWYEAGAYAEYRGKRLPTLFQWEKAARDRKYTHLHGFVMPWGLVSRPETFDERANFKGRGTVPVDSCEFGMSPYGCYHMAGNAAEWCLNRGSVGFAIAGGSWKDPMYLFGTYGEFPGFYSASSLGFRCARTAPGAGGDQGEMRLDEEGAVPQFKPVGEADFQSMLRFYQYDRTPLEAQVVEVKETEAWRREKLTYAGAAGQRALAYLYLPKGVRRPLQVIHYVPSFASRGGGLTVPQEAEVVGAPFIKAGRALFVVVPQENVERWPGGLPRPDEPTVKFRDFVVHETIDLRRGLDYLESRTAELDTNKIACFALSVASERLVGMAVETRYRAALIMSGGLFEDDPKTVPEASPVNFVPYIRPPKLLLNARYDEAISWKTEGEPLYRLLREPKELFLVDDGHFAPLEKWVPRAREFFDRQLGPVPGP
jgi:formylglycine-generating enzyme required for sulfatase activity